MSDWLKWQETAACATIRFLLGLYDHVLLQETWAVSNDALRGALMSAFPGAHFAASSFSGSKKGVAILSRAAVLRDYEPTVYSSDTRHGRGHIVSVLWQPRSGEASADRSYRTTCAYISSSAAARSAQAREIRVRIPPARFHILGADTNFVMDRSDVFSFSAFRPSPVSWRETWQACLNRHGLEEAYQPTHTRYQQDPKVAMARSSRLDRIYVARPVDHVGLFDAKAWVAPGVPNTITAECARTGAVRYVESLPPLSGVSDHIPVGLRFLPRHQASPRKKSLPKWVLKHPSFLPTFSHLWSQRRTEEEREEMDGFAARAAVKGVAYAAATLVSRAVGNSRQRTLSELAQIGLATMRVVATTGSSNQDVWEAAQGRPEVVDQLDFGLTGRHRAGRLRLWLEKALLSTLEPPIPRDCASPPSAPGPPRPSLVQSLARTLPRVRPRITGLLDRHGRLTADPAGMTDIARDFWGDMWVEEPPGQDPMPLYQAWGKRAQRPPPEVGLAEMEAAIMAAGNTAAGPDGIPFLFYKVAVDVVGPILLACLRQLKSGALPPADFNAGVLHLIPKKGTPLIADTRPIVVNNTDNRIIASAMKASLTVVLAPLIDPAQTGSVPGRQMEDNILFFNERFYGAMEEGGNYDLLLFDFAKAFDSVSHEALFKLLDAVGLPKDWCTAIRGLFTDAHCYTTLGAAPAKIDFHKGIKQGCPLSPLLFVLLMDVLYTLIKDAGPDIDGRVYVDDTAAGSQDICPHLGRLAAAFRLFRRCTGLTLNLQKSVVLTTRPPGPGRRRIRRCLDAVGWDAFQVVDSAPYLGLPFGRGVEVGDAFVSAINRFEERAARYFSLVRAMSIPRRIVTANVFLLPIVEYPSRFFTIRSNQLEDVGANLRQLFMRYNDVSWQQLRRPGSLLGHSQALRDVRLSNVASLAARLRQGEIRENFDPWRENDSMRISTQVQIAVSHAMTMGVSENTVRCGDKAKIYSALLKTDYVSKPLVRYLRSRLLERGITMDLHSEVFANFGALPRWVPSYARAIVIDIVQNGVPTAKRLSQLQRHGGRPGPHTDVTEECYFCGTVDGDDANHYFVSCEVALGLVIAARSYFGLPGTDRQRLGEQVVGRLLGPEPTAIVMELLDAAPPDDLIGTVLGRRVVPALESGVQCLITYALWRLRQAIRSGYTIGDRQKWVVGDVQGRLLASAPSVLADERLPGNAIPEALKAAALQKCSGIGSSGTRSEAQKVLARKRAAEMVEALPADAIQVWTDGSANPNPGPCGAGGVVVYPGGRHVDFAKAIGYGTNNLGELVAVGAGVESVRGELMRCADVNAGGAGQALPQVHIFSDSQLVINFLRPGTTWSSREHYRLVSAVRALFRGMKGTCCQEVSLHHVGGHCGIPLNERADAMAERGMHGSEGMGAPVLDVASMVLEGGGFLGLPNG